MISLIFYMLGFSIIVLSLLVLTVLNPIHKVAYLCALFLNGAFIFLSLDFYFLGLTYIIVYVGAIAIIFLFVIMMIKLDLSVDSLYEIKPKINTKSYSITNLKSEKPLTKNSWL